MTTKQILRIDCYHSLDILATDFGVSGRFLPRRASPTEKEIGRQIVACKLTHVIDKSVRVNIDCPQSAYFSVGFSRLVRFDGAAAILVCKSERDLGRVSKLPRGGERQLAPTTAPLGSLDTLPRSRSLLQTKMVAAPSKRTSLAENPPEK